MRQVASFCTTVNGFAFALHMTKPGQQEYAPAFRSVRFPLILILLFSVRLQAQDSLLCKPVTIESTLCSVDQAIKMIEKKTGLSFSYNSGVISKKKTVTLQAKNEPLIEVLKRMLDDETLTYSIIGKHLVIFRVLDKSLSPAFDDSMSQTVIELTGRVLDKNDRSPLQYAMVYLSGTHTGIVTNEKGYFILRLKSRHLTDTLVISYIGYTPVRLPVHKVMQRREFLLKPDFVSIQEVIIRKMNPVSLLLAAREKIGQNYPRSPMVLQAFYRELVKRDNRFMVISEALIEHYKAYPGSAGGDRIRIVKGRKTEQISPRDTLLLKLKAGLNTMILLDVVRNMPDFLSGESLSDYEYRLADLVVDNGRDCYVIEFKPKEMAPFTYYSGRIVLDARSLAYRSVEFEVAPEQLAGASPLFILRKPPYLKVKVLKASYRVSFRYTGETNVLQLIQCSTAFRIRNRNEFGGRTYETGIEMAVTDATHEGTERFKNRDTARLNEFFTDQVGVYDASFWGTFNFIAPDESLEEAIAKLSRMLENQRE